MMVMTPRAQTVMTMRRDLFSEWLKRPGAPAFKAQVGGGHRVTRRGPANILRGGTGEWKL
jgi:hypothetical protein